MSARTAPAAGTVARPASGVGALSGLSAATGEVAELDRVGCAAAPPRPLRRDAARNRTLLLAAAASVFADQGLGASVEDIAHQAGVGMGTLYRRFPTKEDLVEELVQAVLSRFVDLAEDATVATDGTGFESFLWAAVDLLATHRSFLPRLWDVLAGHELIDRTRTLVAELLADAKAHGQIRDDAADTDVSVILWSLRGIIETTHGNASGAWERHLELVLIGLRPSNQPLTRPPLRQQQLDDLRAAAHPSP